MHSKKVWRYYCDHCKKSGCNSAVLKKHEAGCWYNPNRMCGMCKIIDEEPQKPMAELLKVLNDSTDPLTDGLENLQKAANGCPNCIMATIVQWCTTHSEWSPYKFDYDYKKSHKEFWSDITEKDLLMDMML